MIRHSRDHPCRVCGGHADLPRHRGRRCFGFRSDDGRYEHCTRKERAGNLELHGATRSTYAHRLDGPCKCGVEHDSKTKVTASFAPVVVLSDVERIARARKIWDAGKPLAGTIAEKYLHNRKIDLSPWPASLRFAWVWHAPSMQKLPCLIAKIVDVNGNFLGVHRIYLKLDGSGYVGKRMLGPVRGGAVRFHPPAHKIAIAEGIETALSVMTAMPERAVWSALSTSGLRTIELPPLASEVVIFADADPNGLAAAKDGGRRLAREGRSVRIARPPSGVNDFNDVLRGAG